MTRAPEVTQTPELTQTADKTERGHQSAPPEGRARWIALYVLCVGMLMPVVC